MATEKNLTFQLGETWGIDFALEDAAGAALDLTDATVAFVMHKGKDQVLMLSSDASEIAFGSPVGGTGTIEVGPDDQLLLDPEVYLYEVRAILADERVSVQAFGRIVVGASLFAWPAAST